MRSLLLVVALAVPAAANGDFSALVADTIRKGSCTDPAESAYEPRLTPGCSVILDEEPASRGGYLSYVLVLLGDDHKTPTRVVIYREAKSISLGAGALSGKEFWVGAERRFILTPTGELVVKEKLAPAVLPDGAGCAECARQDRYWLAGDRRVTVAMAAQPVSDEEARAEIARAVAVWKSRLSAR